MIKILAMVVFTIGVFGMLYMAQAFEFGGMMQFMVFIYIIVSSGMVLSIFGGETKK